MSLAASNCTSVRLIMEFLAIFLCAVMLFAINAEIRVLDDGLGRISLDVEMNQVGVLQPGSFVCFAHKSSLTSTRIVKIVSFKEGISSLPNLYSHNIKFSNQHSGW